jgi:hypothetical protein
VCCPFCSFLGVFSDEDDDADVEMLLSAEEQLQKRLNALRDSVIAVHCERADSRSSGRCECHYMSNDSWCKLAAPRFQAVATI